MITQSSSEIELEIQERLKKAEKACAIKEPRHRKDPAAEERQRILATLAGMRRQFLDEMSNISAPEDNKDVLLVLNAKVVAIEQAMDEIERGQV